MADEQPQTVSTTSPAAAAAGATGPRFFTIYKKGQGYWTRLGTAIAAATICVLLAQFMYVHLKTIQVGETQVSGVARAVMLSPGVAAAIAFAVCGLLALFFWRLMNKPGNVDFLIATDSEMKKVNWTTRKELIGSTKVVIFFVLLISAVLFLLDVAFGYLFYVMKVLVVPPL